MQPLIVRIQRDRQKARIRAREHARAITENLPAILRTILDQTPPTGPAISEEDEAGRPDGHRGCSLDARALAVFIEHPEWSKKKIAEQLGCNAKNFGTYAMPQTGRRYRRIKGPSRPRNNRQRVKTPRWQG